MHNAQCTMHIEWNVLEKMFLFCWRDTDGDGSCGIVYLL